VRIKTKEHLTEYVLFVNKRHLEVYVRIEKKTIKVAGLDERGYAFTLKLIQ
jgi:hypothetical protein